MKRMLFLMVALLTSVGIWAFEVDGIYYSVVSEENHTVEVTGYNSSYDGDLILNGTVTYNNVTYNVVSIADRAFENCTSLTSVSDLSACTSIGYRAFFSCTSLTTVGDLSACTSIGHYAFHNCSNLTNVGDLSACTSIREYTFFGCSSLSCVGDLSACTSIGENAFKGVEKIAIPNSTPPTLTGVPSDAGTTFIVPAAALDAYRAADYWADIKFQIIADNVTTEYDVNAPLLDAIGANNLTNVMKLKVTGDIDSEDIMFIRNNMVNLHHLDLTNANYKASDNEYASGKRTADNSVGGLYELLRLRSVKLPTSAKRIEGGAFINCSYLTDVIVPEGIERIEDGIASGIGVDPSGESYKGAFSGCAFTFISLPNSLKYIGGYAFKDTPLASIVISEELTEVGESAFRNTSISTITFYPKLKTIREKAFYKCYNLSSVILPTSLSSIGSNAFQYNSALTELRIPSSVESIGSEAFAGCSNLKKIYTYVVDPIDINTNTFSTYASATLYIPEQCENTYFRNPQWGQFLNKKTFNEPYTYFYANNDVVLNDGERFDAEAGEDIDFSGNAGSSITIEGDTPQPLGYMDLYFNGTKWASVMADENLTATHVRFHIPVTGNRWYFFSFPFRVYINKVTSPGNYVFRCYDGAQRASNGNTGWKSLSGNTEYLEPGVGYIYQCNKTGELIIEVEAPDFDWNGTNKTNPLTAYTSGTGISDQHASWNFVGNPMTNYYDIDDMSYTSPLTIWNGSSYVAYRPGDDNYQLSPFEAFFVQKPVSGSDPTYTKDNRMSYNASKARHNNKEAAAASRRAAENNKGRYLTNLVLSNGENEDQTRVVFNENTKRDYEMACDAAKFMSMEQVPQLFSVDTQTRFAINERPQGEVTLGFTAPKAGSYTLRAERMDMPMVVKDLVMGTMHELENGEYTFEPEAGTFENRFVLMPASEATAISNAKTEGAEAEDVYTLDGKQLPTTAKGINIVRKGNEVQKIVTK